MHFGEDQLPDLTNSTDNYYNNTTTTDESTKKIEE
jgi:hypothetical protein